VQHDVNVMHGSRVKHEPASPSRLARPQDDDTSAKRLRILAEASLGHGLSPTLGGSDDHFQRPQQRAEHRRHEDPRRQQPPPQHCVAQPRASQLLRPAQSAPVERRGSGGGFQPVLGSASDGSPNAEGLSTGTASGTASVGAIAGRGAAADAAPMQLVRRSGEAQAGIGANRDGSPESKWAAAGGSPLRDPAGLSLPPPVWRATSVADAVTGGALAGRPVGLPPRPSELVRTSSQDLQTARSMSVDAGTPRAHAAPQPQLDSLQHRLQTPEQREHAHRSRGATGMWSSQPQARLTVRSAVQTAHTYDNMHPISRCPPQADGAWLRRS